MARYFTSKDREHIIKISTMEGTLKIITDEMATHSRPKSWLKTLRMAQTWIGKANQAMADECSDQELKKLWKYYEKFELMMLPTSEAKLIAKQQDLIMVSRDAVFDLAEIALDLKCKGCQITDHDSCKYKKAMMSAGVVSWEETTSGKCHYQYEEGSDE